MSKIEVRMASIADLDDAAKLFEASVRDHVFKAGLNFRSGFDWRRETLLRIERSSSRYLLAYLDGEAVGIQAVHLGGVQKRSLCHRIRRRFVTEPTSPFETVGVGTLTDGFVAEPYRNKGVGRALVSASTDLLEKLGYLRVGMEVLAINEPMQNLAASLGFKPTTVRLIREQ